MNIVEALRNEEAKLKGQLAAIQSAIVALNGSETKAASMSHAASANESGAKRTMSAVARAQISRTAKARWAKIRAEKAKKGE